MHNIKWELNPDFKDLEAFLLDIRSFFINSNELIHDARNQLKIVRYNNLDIVIKSFKKPNIINQFAYSYLRDSKAKKSYLHALKLEKLDITTPTPIGYIEFYDSTLLQDSYFLSIQTHYDFTIREVLLNHDWPDHDLIFQEFGRFTYHLHEKGVLHKDYSPGNILISKTDERQYRFDLVDINRMDFTKLSTTQKMKNLSKLWANENDMRLIASAYAQEGSLDIENTVSEMIKYDLENKRVKNFKKKLKAML
jgi:tRNA A-37 threonylcarbamoyl transferase component Bud32